ncbi:MAG TPA: ABC transporter permease [Alphaproteobacteria bacterium]|nr:ABC transporter permease [Alphaproteobacteria bacterium]
MTEAVAEIDEIGVAAWKRWALWAIAGGVLLFLLLPIALIILLSFSSARYLQFPPPGFSLQWYRTFLQDPQWMTSLWLSFRVSLMCTGLSVVLGVLAAVVLVRRQFPGKTAVYVLILSPLIVPGIIIAIAVFFLFSRLHMIGSPVAMALGQTVLTLPLVVVIVSATLQGFDQRLEQAAIILGASPLRAFIHVTLPIIAPGVVSSALFAFLASFDELLVPLLLSSPTTMTLPVRIWTSVIMQIDPTITAVSSTLVAVAVAVLLTAGLLRRIRQ